MKQSIEQLPNKVQVMKILFEETKTDNVYTSAINYYEVFVYGKDEISNFWNGIDNKRPAPICEVEAKLIGRLKISKDNKEYNNLTLVFKKINFIYEQSNKGD